MFSLSEKEKECELALNSRVYQNKIIKRKPERKK